LPIECSIFTSQVQATQCNPLTCCDGQAGAVRGQDHQGVGTLVRRQRM